jgi:hypothetical protein
MVKLNVIGSHEDKSTLYERTQTTEQLGMQTSFPAPSPPDAKSTNLTLTNDQKSVVDEGISQTPVAAKDALSSLHPIANDAISQNYANGAISSQISVENDSFTACVEVPFDADERINQFSASAWPNMSNLRYPMTNIQKLPTKDELIRLRFSTSQITPSMRKEFTTAQLLGDQDMPKIHRYHEFKNNVAFPKQRRAKASTTKANEKSNQTKTTAVPATAAPKGFNDLNSWKRDGERIFPDPYMAPDHEPDANVNSALVAPNLVYDSSKSDASNFRRREQSRASSPQPRFPALDDIGINIVDSEPKNIAMANFPSRNKNEGQQLKSPQVFQRASSSSSVTRLVAMSAQSQEAELESVDVAQKGNGHSAETFEERNEEPVLQEMADAVSQLCRQGHVSPLASTVPVHSAHGTISRVSPVPNGLQISRPQSSLERGRVIMSSLSIRLPESGNAGGAAVIGNAPTLIPAMPGTAIFTSNRNFPENNGSHGLPNQSERPSTLNETTLTPSSEKTQLLKKAYSSGPLQGPKQLAFRNILMQPSGIKKYFRPNSAALSRFSPRYRQPGLSADGMSINPAKLKHIIRNPTPLLTPQWLEFPEKAARADVEMQQFRQPLKKIQGVSLPQTSRCRGIQSRVTGDIHRLVKPSNSSTFCKTARVRTRHPILSTPNSLLPEEWPFNEPSRVVNDTVQPIAVCETNDKLGAEAETNFCFPPPPSALLSRAPTEMSTMKELSNTTTIMAGSIATYRKFQPITELSMADQYLRPVIANVDSGRQVIRPPPFSRNPKRPEIVDPSFHRSWLSSVSVVKPPRRKEAAP